MEGLTDMTVTCDKEVKVECSVDLGNPKADVTVFKNKTEIFKGNKKVDWRVIGEDVVEVVLKEMDEDCGLRVVLENKLGADETQAKITVQR